MNAEQIIGIINRHVELFITYLCLTILGCVAIILIVNVLGLGWVGFVVKAIAVSFFARYMGLRSGRIVREREGL